MPTVVPSQQRSPRWGIFVCVSNTIKPRSMDAAKEERNISSSLLDSLREKQQGREERRRQVDMAGFTCLVCVPCSCNPYPAVLTNSAVSPKQTMNQMSTPFIMCLKAGQKILKMQSL